MSRSLALDSPSGPIQSESAVAEATASATPGIFDTYALLYALTLVFLVPGAVSIGRLAFRDYTFSYVALVTLPGLIGVLLMLFTDSRDSIKTLALRAAILTPLIALTGVTVLFTSSFVLLPIGQVLTPSGFDIAGPVAMFMLLLLATPLVPALVRRVRLPLGWRSVIHVVALLFAIAVVVGVIVLTIRPDHRLATMERKDATIYIVGALAWYLPAFGISAGIWRRVGLI